MEAIEQYLSVVLLFLTFEFVDETLQCFSCGTV